MFFKNVIAYQLTDDLPPAFQIRQSLSYYHARPCGAVESATFGFVAPCSALPDILYHPIDHAKSVFFVCTQKEEKIIPAAAVSHLLNAKIAEVEEAESRKLPKKERQRFKDEIIFSILPRALTKTTKTYAYIDLDDKMIVVDAASPKKAEDVLTLLRRALGSLPVVPLDSNNSPTLYLTNLVSNANEDEQAFTIRTAECELRSAEGEVIRTKDQDLTTDEIQNHLDVGKEVAKISLEYDDKLSFTLTTDLFLKKLKFLDVLQEQVADMEPEDELSQFRAEGAIMVSAMRELFSVLGEELGGFRHSASVEEELA